MISITPSRAVSVLPLLLALSFSLSACATKPDRRGPPPDRQGDAERGDRGPAKSSGTFLYPVAGLFIEMDVNKDHVTTLREVQAGATAQWGQFGRNPSAIDFAQWSLVNLGSTDAMPTFMSFDGDFNGVITQAEFSSELEREFERLDKNKDGRLERSEMIVAFAARQGEPSSKGGGGGRKERGQGGGGRPPR
eukprot:GHVR01188099.1.p1 GENE.GHVR01188099.1~~GHVR01188099.1.p1  ORF type:complete len:192 (+),score=10.86 GHVR01188099.1:91-666(+)